MKVQSLSIHVPTKGCVNNCPYCVSQSHRSRYPDKLNITPDDFYEQQVYGWYRNIDIMKSHERKEYVNRLNFVKEAGVNNIILTGEGEPLQNMSFLRMFKQVNEKIGFRWIEIQTAGNFLLNQDDEGKYPNLEFLKEIGVNTVSLSIANIFDSKNNADILKMPDKHRYNIEEMCSTIKEAGFNLRLSINLLNLYKYKSFDEIFERLTELKVDQVTFRILYHDGSNENVSAWIQENAVKEYESFPIDLIKYILRNGKYLGRLPFGAAKYSIDEISTVVDDNCMDDASEREEPDTYKYLILRPNAKLYSDWEDKGSLIF